MNAFRLARAQILPGVGGGGGADGVVGAGAERVHFRACGDRCHSAGAQPVDGGLQQDAADGSDGILQTHGQAHVQQVPGIDAPEAQVLPAQVQQREPFYNESKTQKTRNQLAKEGGPAGAGNAHVERNDEYDIQHHIHQTGQNQEHQRRPGVAQRADNAGQQIIQHGGGNAKENHPDIIVGIGEGLLRGVHPTQNRSAQGGGSQRDDQGNGGSQPDHVAHKPAKALKILLTELLGHRNGKAGAHAVAQAQHQKVDGAGGADACQRVHPQKFTNHDRIDHAVELLKQQTKQQR